MSNLEIPAILAWIEPYNDLQYDSERHAVMCLSCGVQLPQLKYTFILKHINSIRHQTKTNGNSCLIQKWIDPYEDLKYDADLSVIHCNKCDVSIASLKKYNVTKHVNSAQHKIKSGIASDFYLDLCMFLINCNIPWNKLNNPNFRKFMEKYICCKCSNKKLPEASTLRKYYVQKCYTPVIEKIRNALYDCYLWLSVEETMDVAGNSVLNVIVKSLQGLPSRPYLLSCRVIENMNGFSIAELVEESLVFLWQSDFQKNISKFVILCTNSAAYMLLAGKVLKQKFYNMKHVTCLADGLHQVADQIRSENDEVDTLVSSLKEVFLKSPQRTRLFKEMVPDVPLPPQPVITKSATWLKAVSYYAAHYEKIKNLIFELSNTEDIAVLKAQAALSNVNIQNQLSFIKDNYEIIIKSVTMLENTTTKISIQQAFQILDEIREYFTCFGPENVQDHLEKVLYRSSDLAVVRVMANSQQFEKILEHATLTLVDVERSFSSHKWILGNNRVRFTPENMEKIVVIESFHNWNYEKDNACTISYQDETLDPVATCSMETSTDQ